MSGERRSRIAGMIMLILLCFILALAVGAGGEEAEGVGEDNELLYNFNVAVNGEAAVACRELEISRGAAANSLYDFRWDTQDDADGDGLTSFYWTGYYSCYNVSTASVEEQTLYISAVTLGGSYGTKTEPKYVALKEQVVVDLIEIQQPEGSWNNDVGDTALASHGLLVADQNSGPAMKGIEWLQEYEDPKTHSWGPVDDDAKAILALDSAGVEVWEEIAALMLKQKPDGSFGGIEETSWAVIALSTNYNVETARSMEKAVTWLRSQEYDNNQDLALAALAEQYYEDAKFREEQDRDQGGGKGFIPPPRMYVLSALIIGAIVIPYWLFARLERDGILDGPRKDIYKYVRDHPGEHLASITKTLGLSSSSIRYHLSVLEGMDLIVTHKNGKYKRYYINKNGYSKYTNGNGYKHIMSALKNNTARNIVKFLLSHPKANQKRVSKALDIHPSTVTWHAKRLEEAEIISKERKGKEIHYSLNADVQLRKVIGIIEGSPAY